MRVQSLLLRNFTRHADTTLLLPECGVVAITGPNGSGKSSVVEGVSFCGFGETLRGTSPWRDGEGGAVELRAEEVLVRRAKGPAKNAKVAFDWNLPDQPVTEYETNTKAQEALETVIGPFNVWRRTSVFSSQDAAHFTMSTDGERKRLLEAILNLSRFDTALERCRIESKVAADRLMTNTTGLATLRAKLESEKARLKDAQSTLATTSPLMSADQLREQFKRAEAQLAQVRRDINDINDQLRALDRKTMEAAVKVTEAHRRLREIDKATCGACGQPIAAETIEKQRAAAEAAEAEGNRATEAQAGERSALHEQLNELEAEQYEFQKRADELRVKLAGVDQNNARRVQAETLVQSCTEAVGTLQDRITKGDALVVQQTAEVHVLDAVELVLGMKGVRAHVLGKTLTGLEAVANSWLARIAGSNLTLSMKPYSEKKTGGVSDAISLEISGAGGGYGYKAASAGERRRLDVALLLALAEVAQAAHQRGVGGTLFIDEAFDSLDRDGIVAVSKALRELAKDRCIVVITHDSDLVEELRPDKHYRADAGTLKAA